MPKNVPEQDSPNAPASPASQTTAPGPQYTFQLLPDEPVETDAFDGPHKRVANLIADMIDQGEFKGKMVALEGGWGSGKSSVIKMVEKRLEEIEQRSEDRQYRCVTFDAWSHQGDPLRRGFVEALDQELKSNGKESDWLLAHRKKGKDDQNESVEKEIGKLAKRVTESDDTTQRTPTLLALFFAFSVVMVPIGTAIMTVTADGVGPFNWWGPVHKTFTFGTVLTSAPVLVAIANVLRLWIRRKGVFNPKNWPVLNDTAEIKSKSTTITTADPTSIEFEETFAKIMAWALKKEKQRRLVIIIDNLDRVEAKRALAMWATLQTFFECKSRRDKSEWWDRLCFIAPFDSEAIQKLLSHSPDDHGHERENSFIDKSFATRFRVPPIVLTEWQAYFGEQLRQACRGINENEVQDVIRVCDGFRVMENGFHPTPRNIKKVINQAVNLLRQWGDESRYTPAVVTCFVLLSRTHNEELLTKKLEDNDVLNAVKRVIGEDGTRALAGLLYNTTPDQGEVILLQRPISDALSSGDGETMKKLIEDHGNGFWAVFEQNINEDRSSYIWEFFDGCIRIAHTLDWNLETHPSIKRFYEIITSKLESERDTQIPSQELAERLVMLKDIDLPDARRLAFEFWGRTTKRNEKSKTPPPTLDCIRALVDGLTNEAPGKTDGLLSLNMSDDEWLNLLGEIGSSGPWDGLKWVRQRTGVPRLSISSALQEHATGQSFSEKDRFVVQALSHSNNANTWGKLAPVIGEALTNRGAKGTDTEWLLKTLLDMRKANVKQGNIQLSKLADPAHLLDWVYTYNIESNEPMEMLCMYAFLAANPSGQVKKNVGNSSHGLTQLNAHLNGENASSPFLDLLVEFGDVGLLISLLQKREKIDTLVRAALLSAHDDGYTDDVLSLNAMWQSWNELVDVFGRDVVLKQLPKHGDALVKEIASNDLYSQDTGMYEALLLDADASWYAQLSGDLNQKFNEWTQEKWAEELTSKGTYTGFIESLFGTPAAPKFNDQFMQGLSTVAKKMIEEGTSLVESIKNHQAWLEHFKASDARDTLAGYILKHILDSKNCPPDQLLEMFGSILAQQVVRAAKDMNLGQFLYQIVNSPTDTNLQWVAGLCEEDSLDVRAGTEDDGLFPNKIRELLADESMSEKRRAWLDAIAAAALLPEPDAPEPEDSEQ